ncbi:hypothetical protein EJV44_19495 [Ancylobacter aquaticus]|nr:hypothetical protein EJV44_19495 [Ancylobacter aquaticus]
MNLSQPIEAIEGGIPLGRLFTSCVHHWRNDHVELLENWLRASMFQRWRDNIKLVPVSWLR